MKIVGVDVETTGLDPDKDEIVEFAMVCYDGDIELGCYSTILQTNYWEDQCHGISQELSSRGAKTINPWPLLREWNPRYILAHKVSFDYEFITRRWPELTKIPWLCTKFDLPHRDEIRMTSSRLMHLGIDYGFQVDGWHRALTDARMVCKIATKHDLDQAYERSRQQRYAVIAIGRWSEEHRKKLVAEGFRYDYKEKIYEKRGILENELDHYVNLAKGEVWEAEFYEMKMHDYQKDLGVCCEGRCANC